MTPTPNIALLTRHWRRATPKLRKALYDVTRYPLERNECYLVGYLAALNDHKLIAHGDYTYWLAYSHNPHPEVLALWKTEP